MTIIINVLLACLVLIGQTLTTRALKKVNTVMEEQVAMKNATVSMLWAELEKTYKRCMKNGFCSFECKKRIQLTYDSYHALGGNGIGTEMYNRLLTLPSETLHCGLEDD